MSVIYVYGFARPVERDGLAGLDGDQVGLLSRGDVALLCSELESEDAVNPWDGLVAHNRVLSSALEQGPVVPLQAGSLLAPEECERLLEGEHDRADRLLSRFEGRIEVKVQFTYHEEVVLREIVAERPQLARNGPGYLDRVRAGEEIFDRLEQKRARESPELLGALEPHCEASVVHEGDELAVLNASFLVEQEEALPRFEEALGRLQEQHADRMALKYIGPLPFYSFAEA